MFNNNRQYSDEEKASHVKKFNQAGVSIKEFAREHDIPESTFRGWLEKENPFGKIGLNQEKPTVYRSRQIMAFACENIKIELKEGYDKIFLAQIIEVLTSDR